MACEVAEIDTSGLEFFYDPRSIDIVGASQNPDKPGGRPLAALRSRGYRGRIFPINPRQRELAGPAWHPTILDVPDDVDMGVIAFCGAYAAGSQRISKPSPTRFCACRAW